MNNGCVEVRRECVDPYQDLPGCDCFYGCTMSTKSLGFDLNDMSTVRTCLYSVPEGPGSEEYNAQRKAEGNPVCRESLLAHGFEPDEVLWSAIPPFFNHTFDFMSPHSLISLGFEGRRITPKLLTSRSRHERYERQEQFETISLKRISVYIY